MRYVDAYAGDVVEFADMDTDHRLVFGDELRNGFGAGGMPKEVNSGEDIRLDNWSTFWEVGHGPVTLVYGESELGTIIGICSWNVIFQSALVFWSAGRYALTRSIMSIPPGFEQAAHPARATASRAL